MTQPGAFPQIRDRASLEVWMTDMPREFVAVIGTRAAMRALPMLVRDFTGDTPDLLRAILLRILRVLSTASAGTMWPHRAPEVWEIAIAVVPRLQAVSSVAEIAGHVSAGHICSASEDALRLFSNPAGYIRYSANAITASTSIVGAGSWEAVSRDAEQLPSEWTDTGGAPILAAGLYARPLWPKGAPPQAGRAWTELKTVLPADEDWWVWTDWYEDHLAGRPPDQSLDFARITIPERDWEHGPKHVNSIIAKLMDGMAHSSRNSSPGTPVTNRNAASDDASGLVDQPSIFDELIDPPLPELPGQQPAPLHFRFHDQALHTAGPPAPQLSSLPKHAVAQSWHALSTMLSDLLGDPSGRNHPTLGRVLDACRRALGSSFDDVQPILLGIHARRLHELAVRADDILLPDVAAELTAVSVQLALFLQHFPDWQDYASALAQPFGTVEVER